MAEKKICAAWRVCRAIAILLTGRQTAYYKTMEKPGVHKREIPVDWIGLKV